MRYFVTVGDRTFEVELAGEQALVNGRPVRAELRAIPEGDLHHLLVDAESRVLLAEPGDAAGAWHVQLDGRRFTVEVVDERTRAIRAMTGRSAVATGPKPLRAPMPGLIVRVEVEAGEIVKVGQGAVIMEAMKMENELRVDTGGVVQRVLVAPGQAVEKGQVLIEFETPP